jgi:hypothetical protein
MSTALDLDGNAPSEFQRIFDSLPPAVQYALRYAYNHGYTFNDVWFMANDAVTALRNLTPDEVARGIGAAVGGTAYLAWDSGSPATSAGLRTAAGIGAGIAGTVFGGSSPTSPTVTEVGVNSNAEVTPAQTNLPRNPRISPDINPGSRVRNNRRQINLDGVDDPPNTWDWAGMMNNPQNPRIEGNAAAAPAGAPAGQPGASGSRRTILPLYRAPKRGFFEKDVVVALPVVINFSINKLDRLTPIVFRFQLNDTYDQYRQYTESSVTFPTFTQQDFINRVINATIDNKKSIGYNIAPPVVPATFNYEHGDGKMNEVRLRNKGISRDMAYDQWVSPQGLLIKKPVNLNCFEARQFIRTTPSENLGTTNGTTGASTIGSGQFGRASAAADNLVGEVGRGLGDIKPDGRDYYETMYSVRHVHACNWKMTIENGSASDQSKAVCIHKTETITSGLASATQNLTVNSNLHNATQWPNTKKDTIQGGYSTITGQWRSKDSAKNHDVIDADEIKDWYSTGIPNESTKKWEEYQTMLFYADSDTVHNPSFNVRFEAEWIVEYRDMKKLYRDIDRTTSMIGRTLGKTGTMNDLYTTFATPAEGTNWPWKRDAWDLVENQQIADFFGSSMNNH